MTLVNYESFRSTTPHILHDHPTRKLRAIENQWAIYHRGIQISDSLITQAHAKAHAVDLGLMGFDGYSRTWKAPDYQLGQIGKPLARVVGQTW